MADTTALNDFPPSDMAAWRRLALGALEGRPFEALISRTFEGLEIEPLYQGAATEGPRAFRQAPGPWKIAQRIDHPDPVTANAMARTDLAGGADALTLTVAGTLTARGFGTAIGSTSDLDAALDAIDLDRVPIRVDAGSRSLDIADGIAELAHDRRLTSAALDIDLGHDPMGCLARSGRLPVAPEAIGRAGATTSRTLRDRGFSGRLFLADGRAYHEAGAGEAQELGCVLATAVAYLRLLEGAELGLEEARDEIAFLLAADADPFLTLAKFRALRQLWARVETACGLEPKPVRLHAETSFRMMTRSDPRVNALRTTAAAFGAAMGGADAITVLPHTLALGLPDAAARRLARNTGLVLIHEAHLARAADPAAGSGAFEALTEALCRRAWALFQDIERQGGMIASLIAGVPQAVIGATAAARQAAIACRHLAIIGTSAYPDLAALPVEVLEVAARVGSDARQPTATATCTPLPSRRDAEPFEALRATSDAFLARTGGRPRIFVIAVGTTPSMARDTEFARDLFASAGIEALASSGAPTPDETAAAFARSGCRIACICAARPVSPEAIVAHIDALHAAGVTGVWLVGASHEIAREMQLAATVEVIAEGHDVLAPLRKAVTRAAGPAP
jgi:methylmalonyl-CoA mutase